MSDYVVNIRQIHAPGRYCSLFLPQKQTGSWEFSIATAGVFGYKEVIPEYLDDSATFFCLEIFFLICLTLVSLSVFRSHFILEKKKVKDYNK